MPPVSQSFAAKVAQRIGADPAVVYRELSNWQPYEGGDASFNPLNTTQGQGTNYNSTGVKNFANEDIGAAETAATLMNGYYPTLLAELRAGRVTAASAPDIRKWGTTGYAKALAGGQVSDAPPTPTTPAANGDVTHYADLLRKAFDNEPQITDAKYAALDAAQPGSGAGDAQLTLDHAAWATSVSRVQAAYNGAVSAAGRKDQSFANDTTAFDSGIKLDTLNQNNSIADINRFLGGTQESRQRSQQVLDAQKELRMYGVAPGKTSFSYNDLGAGFAAGARDMGIDPAASLVNYTGQTYVDPAAVMRQYDQQFGVTGQIPQIARPMTQYGDIPYPDKGQYQAAPGGGNLLDPQNSIPGINTQMMSQPGQGAWSLMDTGGGSSSPPPWMPPPQLQSAYDAIRSGVGRLIGGRSG